MFGMGLAFTSRRGGEKEEEMKGLEKGAVKKILAVAVIITFVLAASAPAEAKSKTHWKRGMAIGAGAGAVAMGLGLGLAGGLSNSNCSRGDSDMCIPSESLGWMLGLGGAAAGALIGMGLGATIGAAIKVKENDVAVMPIIAPSGDGVAVGIGIRKSF